MIIDDVRCGIDACKIREGGMSKGMCAQGSVPQLVKDGGQTFPRAAAAKHGQVLRGCKELSFPQNPTIGEAF
jgi:hypothetical protein